MSSASESSASSPSRSRRDDPHGERGARPMFDRAPPADVSAEQAVLGGIMLRPSVCDDVVLVLQPSDFFRESHQIVYEALLSLHEEGKSIDAALLVDRLRSVGKLEFVGGIPYLAELQNAVPTAANARYYAEIVRKNSTYRAIIATATDVVSDAYNQELDAEALLSSAEERIFAIRDGRGTGEQATIGDVLREVMTRIDARMQGDHALGGVETGFRDFDALTGGLHQGELIILAARPSMGKTALALNIAEHISIELSRQVLFVSLEMSRLELGDRLLCSRAEVNGQRLRNGQIGADERRRLVDQAAIVSQAPLIVDDTPSRTLSEIAAVARRLQAKAPLDMICIDYLQLIEPENPRDPRQEQVARIARRLKHLARDLKVPVVCLAQLNRQTEASRDNKPRLSHLRESGAIEQDADVVMFVHREEYFATNEEERAQLAGKAEIIIAKQRNGPIGDVPLTWLHKFTRFADSAPAYYEEFGGGGDF